MCGQSQTITDTDIDCRVIGLILFEGLMHEK